MDHDRPEDDDPAVPAVFLRDVVPGWGYHQHGWVPGLWRVHVLHVEDGWVQLRFFDRPRDGAQRCADQLLHPDALLVEERQLGTGSLQVFEGFGWDDPPPPSVQGAGSGGLDPFLEALRVRGASRPGPGSARDGT